MSMAPVCNVGVIALAEKESFEKTFPDWYSKMMSEVDFKNLNKLDSCDIKVDLSLLVEKVSELYPGAWHKKAAMLGCSTSCPNCKHEFTCCPPASACCSQRRSLHVLSGGGLVNQPAPAPAPAAPPCCGDAPSPCPSPQVSPSTPLAFIIPPFPAVAVALPAPKLQHHHHHVHHHHHHHHPQPVPPPAQPPAPLVPMLPFPPAVRPESELQRLGDIERALRQSGWYYEAISYKASDELLRATQLGTFLVRNSADPRYLFSLSMQTERGPSSVRLCYANGFFRLEARVHLQAEMPVFPGVIELVEYYAGHLKGGGQQVWEDPQGKYYSPMVLSKPLRKSPPSLMHLARLAVHRQLQAARPRVRAVSPQPLASLELPASVEAYLAEYPYSL